MPAVFNALISTALAVFFFYLVFLSLTLMNHRTAGKLADR